MASSDLLVGRRFRDALRHDEGNLEDGLPSASKHEAASLAQEDAEGVALGASMRSTNVISFCPMASRFASARAMRRHRHRWTGFPS